MAVHTLNMSFAIEINSGVGSVVRGKSTATSGIIPPEGDSNSVWRLRTRDDNQEHKYNNVHTNVIQAWESDQKTSVDT